MNLADSGDQFAGSWWGLIDASYSNICYLISALWNPRYGLYFMKFALLFQAYTHKQSLPKQRSQLQTNDFLC